LTATADKKRELTTNCHELPRTMPKKKTTKKTVKKTTKNTAAKQPARTSGAVFGPIERLAVAELTPDPANARTHDAANLAAIEASLRANGQYRPAIVNLTDEGQKVVVVGNGMLAAAKAIGWEWLECRACRLSPAQQRAISLADNRTAELADWDLAVLESLVDPMRDDTPDLADALLFDKLLPAAEPDTDEGPPAQTNRADELQAEWKTEAGQLWEIVGKEHTHRLLCGDSTNAEHVERLMGEAVAHVMATDPPYGVNFAGAKYNPKAKQWAGIANDKKQGDELSQWLASVLEVWMPRMAPDACFYLWTAPMQEGAAAATAAAAGIHIQGQIIWVKNQFTLGQADYQWRHEPCWYGYRKGAKHRWLADRKQDTIWSVDKVANAKYEHPHQKPLELYARPVRHHLHNGEIVADPFLGSGTTIIAAEQLGRKCYGMEISAAYCAVILQRCVDQRMTAHLVTA